MGLFNWHTFYFPQVELGDRLLPCFNPDSKIPYSDINLDKGLARAPRWGPDSSTSEVTTIQLEFRDLTTITGENKYAVCLFHLKIMSSSFWFFFLFIFLKFKLYLFKMLDVFTVEI